MSMQDNEPVVPKRAGWDILPQSQASEAPADESMCWFRCLWFYSLQTSSSIWKLEKSCDHQNGKAAISVFCVKVLFAEL